MSSFGGLMLLKALLAVLVVLVNSDASRPAGSLVRGNVIVQQTGANSNNNSLPGLSERAGGLNSRYLSASSTASLAAATVAAAANQAAPQSAANPQVSQSQSVNSNQHNSNSNQQQQQQQQQANNHHHQQQNSITGQHLGIQQAHNQLAASGAQQAGAPNQQQPANTQLAVPPQYNTGLLANNLGQSGAFAGVGSAPTPVMSTTYTFNPQTNQFQPAESSIGAAFPFGAASLAQVPFLQQQQQQLANFGFSSANYPLVRPPHRLQIPYYQLAQGGPLSNQQQQQRFAGAFNRRQGQLPGGAGNQFRQPGAGSLADDDVAGGLFGQPQLLEQQQFNQAANGFDPATGYQLLAGSNQLDTQQQPVAQAQVVFPVAGGSQSQLFQGNQQQQASLNDQCVAADGRHGTCYQASECNRRGGVPMGKCGSSAGSARDDQLPGSSHVCCLFDVTCGQSASERFVYFRNPGYPATFDQKRMCRARIGKLDRGVCQLRLDMLRFDVAKPTNGNCSSDVFVVSGQNDNYVVPKICGFNDGQHYFVGVDEAGVITLHMMMMGLYRRSFEILVTQIPCRSDYAAPAHCLQYFMGTHGTIKSFNYDDELLQFGNQAPGAAGGAYDLQSEGSSVANAGQVAPYGLHFNSNNNNPLVAQQLQQRNQQQQQLQSRYPTTTSGGQLDASLAGYPNDLDYTICIRKESGFCSITYQLSSGEQGLSPFGVGQSGFSQEGAWSQMSTDCRDDYLFIGGVRLCSGASVGGTHQANSPFFDPTAPALHSNQNNSFASQSFGQQQSQLLLQQVQGQYNALLQQLTRVQQQLGNSSSANNLANGNGNANGAGGNQLVGLNANLEQQQAAIVQQLVALQQQQQQLLSGGGLGATGTQQQPATFANRFNNPFDAGQFNPLFVGDNNGGLQGTVITDTTTGPFFLRFVSNTARNARGFHIDYRQNSCK